MEPKDIKWVRSGEYLIPDLEMEPVEEVTWSRWRDMRDKYMWEQDQITYNVLMTSQRLIPHLIEIQKKAEDMMELLTTRMAKKEGVTEELKASNQMEWVGLMNNIRSRAEEIVIKEVIESRLPAI